jgi:hydrogenase nickel incorporation protein HypA/HybF
MHEHSFIANLLRQFESVASEYRAHRVVGVTVRLGALTSISSEHFREHFESETAGTIADGARLIVERSNDPLDRLATQIVLESVEVADEP